MLSIDKSFQDALVDYQSVVFAFFYADWAELSFKLS